MVEIKQDVNDAGIRVNNGAHFKRVYTQDAESDSWDQTIKIGCRI